MDVSVIPSASSAVIFSSPQVPAPLARLTALQARTAGELAGLFTDLPRQQAAVTGTAPIAARAGSFWSALVPAVPIAIIAVVLASILSGHHGLIALVPVLVFFTVRRPAGCRGAGPSGDRTP
jgi:hypothetical protein